MTVWGVPNEAVRLRREPSHEQMFSFYGQLDLLLRGPAVFGAEVAQYFWPQVRPTSTGSVSCAVEVLVGGDTAKALDALPSQSVTLYRSPDGDVPDWNDGIWYTTPWGMDRFVVNPHTGSQFMVAGRHVPVLNPDLMHACVTLFA